MLHRNILIVGPGEFSPHLNVMLEGDQTSKKYLNVSFLLVLSGFLDFDVFTFVTKIVK